MNWWRTLFVAACISRQKQHWGSTELEAPRLLSIHTLSVQVESIGWVQTGHSSGKLDTLSAQTEHKNISRWVQLCLTQ